MKSYEPLKPDSLYWPKSGDEGTEVEGVWEETEPGRFGDLLVVRTDTGIRKVTQSARIAAVRSQMKLGARYRFSFRGTVTLKNGQVVKDITVDRVRNDVGTTLSDPPDEPGEPPTEPDEVAGGAGRRPCSGEASLASPPSAISPDACGRRLTMNLSDAHLAHALMTTEVHRYIQTYDPASPRR
jgi:hypothetical protein